MTDNQLPVDLRYSKEHEWVKVDGDLAVVGLTNHAQSQLGDITYVELPEEGAELNQMDEMCVVESVKAVAEVYAPLSGTIVEVNQALVDEPQLINSDCYGAGWLVKLKDFAAGELENLLDAAGYQELLDSQA